MSSTSPLTQPVVIFGGFRSSRFHPLPSHPEELGLSVRLALRYADGCWWQNQVGGRDDRGEQAGLPADVEQRMVAGTSHPEDEAALRKANMDSANAAAAQREQVIDRARQATRARKKAIYKQQTRKSAEFRSMGLLAHLAASPVSGRAAAQARAL